MLHGLFKDEFDVCFRMLAVDPRNADEISGWYCAAQWACLGMQYPFTKRDLWNLMQDTRFKSAIVNSSLGRYPILQHFDAFYRLCSVTYKAWLLGPQAKFFYRDYLSCAITDTSYFDEILRQSSLHFLSSWLPVFRREPIVSVGNYGTWMCLLH